MAINIDIGRVKHTNDHISMRIKSVIILITFIVVLPSTGWSYQITGTFIQLFRYINYPRPPLDWNTEDWLEEIGYMKKAGIDTIIIQYVIYDNDAYYPSKYGKMVTSRDQIKGILSACQREKMSVYLGLILDSRWWKGVNNTKFLNQLKEKSILVAKELLSKYGKYNCIKGWYLPFEVEDRAWINPKRESMLVSFLKDTGKELRNLNPKFLIITSPYFLGYINSKELAFRWAKLFKLAGIDIIAIQDGAGRMNHKIDNKKIYKYFKDFRDAFRKENLKLWANIEIYHQIKDWPDWDAEPATLDSIKDRLIILGPLVDKIICFEFTHYMSPRVGKKQKELYQNYRRLK